MRKKLTLEQMRERIKKGYYITFFYKEGIYQLNKDGKKTYSAVALTKERAQEWIKAGAEYLEM